MTMREGNGSERADKDTVMGWGLEGEGEGRGGRRQLGVVVVVESRQILHMFTKLRRPSKTLGILIGSRIIQIPCGILGGRNIL